MRYRLEHRSQWHHSLKYAISQARKVTRSRVVDETGKVVWSSDAPPAGDVPPGPAPVEPQGDLF